MLSAENLLQQVSVWHTRMEELYAKADHNGEILAAVATARAAIPAIESFHKISADAARTREANTRADVRAVLGTIEGWAMPPSPARPAKVTTPTDMDMEAPHEPEH